ncbi:MAG: SEC-C domain-containing protein [Clostridia bacterium]|nr:SEC-C domain-containing protein [Clostridia bacterium]
MNTNNIININSIDNIRKSTSCGSGKKYKKCCGKDAE